MSSKHFLILVIAGCVFNLSMAEDITTLDGQTYADVRSVTLKSAGLFFVTGTGDTMKGVTVPYAKLPDELREKYHCDSYEMNMAYARLNHPVNLTKDLAFSLDNLEAAKKKAKDEKKYIGFIMEWDSMLIPSHPMGRDSASALAQFCDVFHDNLVLVFVRHESELGNVPDSVKKGFNGPEEGGFAPNMAVVTADCSEFICEIPYGGKESTAAIREKIFRDKIAVIKKFKREQDGGK